MRNLYYILISAITLILAISCYCPIKNSDRIYDDNHHTVIKIIDGDTFWVKNKDSVQFKVRLIGVDTPEIRNTRNRKKGYYAQEAKNYVDSLIYDKVVRLEFDVDSLDRYGRTLAYIFLEDGKFLNLNLLQEGYGRLMTVPPNIKYIDRFTKAEQQAIRNRKGMWQKDIK